MVKMEGFMAIFGAHIIIHGRAQASHCLDTHYVIYRLTEILLSVY